MSCDVASGSTPWLWALCWRPGRAMDPLRWSCKPTMGIHHACIPHSCRKRCLYHMMFPLGPRPHPQVPVIFHGYPLPLGSPIQPKHPQEVCLWGEEVGGAWTGSSRFKVQGVYMCMLWVSFWSTSSWLQVCIDQQILTTLHRMFTARVCWRRSHAIMLSQPLLQEFIKAIVNNGGKNTDKTLGMETWRLGGWFTRHSENHKINSGNNSIVSPCSSYKSWNCYAKICNENHLKQ